MNFNMRRKFRKTYSTQFVLYPFIVLAQCFGLFPVKGIKGNNLMTITFSWWAKRTLYAIFFTVISAINVCFYIIKQISDNNFLQTFVALVYFTTMLLIQIFFFDLANKWPTIMKKWTDVDLSTSSFISSRIMSHKLKVVSLIVVVAAFTEHALFVANKFDGIPRNVTTTEMFQLYFKKSYQHIFNLFPYTVYMGIIAQIYDIYCVFAWNYRDLFIMLISMALSHKFTQIVKRVEFMSKHKIKEQARWRLIREEYVALSTLCKLVDCAMSKIVILSFTHNLFVVLIQFMYTLHRTDQTFIQRFYFIYSFGFLILRIVSVCVFAAEIYHESRKPLETLMSLPSKVYNIEIERFILQIRIDSPHLSGGHFFIIKRSIILRISGAIVTYELVLIQVYNNS